MNCWGEFDPRFSLWTCERSQLQAELAQVKADNEAYRKTMAIIAEGDEASAEKLALTVVLERPGGPCLYIAGVHVKSWLGNDSNAEAHALAAAINAAINSPSMAYTLEAITQEHREGRGTMTAAVSQKPALKLSVPKALQPHGRDCGPLLAGMPLWARIMCVLGYHRWEERHDVENERFWPSRNKPTGVRMRDQCGRCGAYR